MLGMDKSVFRRLLFSYMLTILIGIGMVGILISYLVKGFIYSSFQEELLRKAKIVNSSIQQNSQIDEASEKRLSFLDQSFDARIWVFNREGRIIATSTQEEVSIGKSVASSIVEKVLRGENAVNRLSFEGLSEPMLSIAVPWGKEDQVYGGIVLHYPVVGLNKAVLHIRETILWATLFGLILSMAMVSYLSWSISRPLQKIDRAAAKIGMGHYEERIEIDSVDEIGDLAQTINVMAEKLAKIDQERKKLDQLRNDFLANVSHELRTPLTAMQGFLEALQDGLIDDEQGRQKYYDVMYKETMHMNRLVEDIIDLMKLENKEISLYRQPVNLPSLLEKVVFKFQPEAESKHIPIHLELDDHLPSVYADHDRLEQIISNILHNAIKFTEKGYISLAVTEDKESVLIQISDTGIGISPEDIELLWERFFKVDRGRPKKNKGTGLGLAIVKELIDLHQGRITVESQLHQGTTFSIWIPKAEEKGVAV